MTATRYRARTRFAIGTLTVVLIALGLSIVVGIGLVAGIAPELQGSPVGFLYGLLLGVPAIGAVLVVRAGVRRHYNPWIAGALVVAGATLFALALFSLVQLRPAGVPLVALTGALITLVAVALAVRRRGQRR
jgi:peptidoglycan/LPS O-acetylase OafA/YrhL